MQVFYNRLGFGMLSGQRDPYRADLIRQKRATDGPNALQQQQKAEKSVQGAILNSNLTLSLQLQQFIRHIQKSLPIQVGDISHPLPQLDYIDFA